MKNTLAINFLNKKATVSIPHRQGTTDYEDKQKAKAEVCQFLIGKVQPNTVNHSNIVRLQKVSIPHRQGTTYGIYKKPTSQVS